MFKTNKYILSIVIIIMCTIIWTFFAIWKLSYIPGIFIDETNYMNEVISNVNFNHDIQGLRVPVYLASVWGQGQSALYYWLIYPIIKIFGFTVFNFRLPMILIFFTMIIFVTCLLFRFCNNKFLSVCVNLSLITTPWIFISARWVLDANISPLFVMFGICFFYLALVSNINKYILLFLSGSFLSLSAYGYIASWLYLPILILILLIVSLTKKWLNFKQIIFFVTIIAVITIPIIIFAYRVNIQKIGHFSKFLFFDIPYLRENRTSSLIDFKGNLLNNMTKNLTNGIRQIIVGTDELPQNSVKPYGSVLPITLLLTLVGLIGNKKISKNANLFRFLMIICLISFTLGLLIIKPNYNHWNFLWIPLAIISGFGLYVILNLVKNDFIRAIPIFFIITIFSTFLLNSYFGINNQKTYFNNFYGSIEQTQKINNLINKNGLTNRFFVSGLYDNFSIFRLVQKPINRDKYVKLQGHTFDNRKKIAPSPELKYGNLIDSSQLNKAKSGDILMKFKEDINVTIKQNEWKMIKKTKFNHHDVEIYQKK